MGLVVRFYGEEVAVEVCIKVFTSRQMLIIHV